MTGARPLAGLRVLDFSWVWSGPMVTALLGEFGAEVIKVEHGERLDSSRLMGRAHVDGQPLPGPSIETSPYYHQNNHDKRSVTLNLKSAEARALLDLLLGKCDILVENLSPGALSRAGLGYERVSALNPRLVYLSMSAAGQTGPSAGMRAYAPIMSSFCGVEGLIGYPGEAPIGMMNFGYGDPNAAIHALPPLLAALMEREATGRGVHIDFSQIEALLAVVAEPVIDRFMNGRDARPSGNRHPSMAPHGLYPARGTDRWVSIAVADDAGWARLVALLGSPDWAADPDLALASRRVARATELDEALGRWTAFQEPSDLVSRLRAAGIACSPVNDVAAQHADPHLEARGLRVEVTHDLNGPERLYRAPWGMERHRPEIRRSAPLLGQDNDYVFGSLLGLPESEIERLRAAGVIA